MRRAQVLLSQVHRLRALVLLGRFLDMGAWAVDLALSVGIFPYVLKLLQTTAADLRTTLVFIWAKILALDRSCQARAPARACVTAVEFHAHDLPVHGCCLGCTVLHGVGCCSLSANLSSNWGASCYCCCTFAPRVAAAHFAAQRDLFQVVCTCHIACLRMPLA